jgi:von Willebrand factor type A domain
MRNAECRFHIHHSAFIVPHFLMIRLTCTSCQTVLTIDDAFAGGVCRCQHCGTIQTVPKRAKAAGAGTQRKIYGKPAERPVMGGLDDLASAVASSGLAEKLRSGAPAPRKASRWPLIVALCIVGLMIAALAWTYLGNRNSPTFASGGPSQPAKSTPAAPDVPDSAAADFASSHEPSFCGIALHSDTVVYVLDRGSASRDSFGYLKEATYKSLATLGPDRKFQVLLWKTSDGSEEGFPLGTPVYATPKNIEICKKALEEIFAFGQTDASAPLKKAVLSAPGEIVLVTGKGWELDDEFVKQVQIVIATSQIKLITISIGSGGDSAALRTLAEKSGGQYQTLSEGAIRGFAD